MEMVSKPTLVLITVMLFSSCFFKYTSCFMPMEINLLFLSPETCSWKVDLLAPLKKRLPTSKTTFDKEDLSKKQRWMCLAAPHAS